MYQALPLRLHERAPGVRAKLFVARVAGRNLGGSGPVKQREVEMGHAEAGDAGLEDRVGAEREWDGKGMRTRTCEGNVTIFHCRTRNSLAPSRIPDTCHSRDHTATLCWL